MTPGEKECGFAWLPWSWGGGVAGEEGEGAVEERVGEGEGGHSAGAGSARRGGLSVRGGIRVL